MYVCVCVCVCVCVRARARVNWSTWRVLAWIRQKFFFISNGRYIDYLSLTYATNKSRILKVTL